MKKAFASLLFLIFIGPVKSQQPFKFTTAKDKVTIPFKLINNLIFIPIKVNGTELNFLLDSGVDETILFSLEEKKDIEFKNLEKIILLGLGSEGAAEGLKSTNNTLQVSDLRAVDHLVYIVLDQAFNLSSHIGIPVNGIIGYNFFRNNIVEINYEKKRITIYRDIAKNRNKIEKKYSSVPISIEKNKPYLINKVTVDSQEFPAKLLIDIGNSDAFWLFANQSKNVTIPTRNFNDYLGRGFSGDIVGKRARITKVRIGDFTFEKPIAAFPDSISTQSVKMVPDRIGSVGGEILRRFTIIMDYSGQTLYLKKNKAFKMPFTYNKSGIEIEQKGMQWVKETVYFQNVTVTVNEDMANKQPVNNFKLRFDLKPKYIISNVRKNSAAAVAGLLKEDVIMSINGNPSHKYSLEQMNQFLKPEEDKWITMEVERENQLLKFKFQLQDVL